MEPFLGVLQDGKQLSDFDFLNKSAVAISTNSPGGHVR